MKATRESLTMMRGLIVSTIVGKIGERRCPELRDYLLDEAAVQIVAKGWVKTMSEFRTVLNDFIEKAKPTKFGLGELNYLTRRCGVETGRYAAIPIYHYHRPQPKEMSDAEATRFHLLHDKAWRQRCAEIARLSKTFGDQTMCEEFDAKQKPCSFDDMVVTGVENLSNIPPLPEGGQRHIFTPKEVKVFTNADWEKLSENLSKDMSIRVALDGRFVVDVYPKVPYQCKQTTGAEGGNQ